MRKFVTALAAAAMLVPAVAQAQALVWIEQAYDRFASETWNVSDSYTMTNRFSGEVPQGQVWRIDFTPQDSGYYTFSGACDHDCNQFSITVFDYRNTQMSRNISYSLGRTTTTAYLNAGQAYHIEFYPEDCAEVFCYTIGIGYR